MIPVEIGAPLIVLAYALGDRFAGGGAPKLDDRLPGRGAFWAGVMCAVLGWLVFGWVASALALGWWLYRIIPPRAIGQSSATPNDKTAYFHTFIRHALPLLPAFLVSKGWALDTLWVCMPFAVYAVAATALAAWYGAANAKAISEGRGIGKENVIVELARGAAFGLAVVVALTLPA